jgi:HAUS augmin-like complex subunit 1
MDLSQANIKHPNTANTRITLRVLLIPGICQRSYSQLADTLRVLLVSSSANEATQHASRNTQSASISTQTTNLHHISEKKRKMAHLQTGAIFSPSVARAAASAQKDWNVVDAWLTSRLGRSPPPFERNADTLRVLLALVSANEAADEERDVLAAVEASALEEINTSQQSRSEKEGVELSGMRDEILGQIENALPREGRTALNALASTAMALGMSDPDPEMIGRRLAGLQGDVFTLDTAISRVQVLRRHIDSECIRLQTLLDELAGEDYRPAPDLAKSNLEIQRRLKASAAGVPKRAAGRTDLDRGLRAEDVRRMEEDLMGLMRERNELDARVKAFMGLPADTDAARRELERVRDELGDITRRRDAVFEGLVERETPRKPRR